MPNNTTITVQTIQLAFIPESMGNFKKEIRPRRRRERRSVLFGDVFNPQLVEIRAVHEVPRDKFNVAELGKL